MTATLPGDTNQTCSSQGDGDDDDNVGDEREREKERKDLYSSPDGLFSQFIKRMYFLQIFPL